MDHDALPLFAALTELELAAVAQLSVFPAPFDLAAAAAVVVLPDDEPPLTTLLADLVRQAYLVEDSTTGHYHLSTAIQPYASDHLVADPAAERWARFRHAQHYCNLAAHLKAYSPLEEYTEASEGVTLFEFAHAHFASVRTWLLVETSNAAIDASDMLLYYAAALLPSQFELYDPLVEQVPYWKAVLAAAQRSNLYPWYVADTLLHLGEATLAGGDPAQARTYFAEMLDQARREENLAAEVAALASLRQVCTILGETEQANHYQVRQDALVRTLPVANGEEGDDYELYEHWEQRAHEQIADCVQQVAQARVVGDRWREYKRLHRLGELHGSLPDESHAAIAYYNQALAVAQDLGDVRSEQATVDGLADIYRRLGAWKTSGNPYTEPNAEVEPESGPAPQQVVEFQKAIDYYKRLLRVSTANSDRRTEAKTLGELALIYHMWLEDLPEAVELYTQQLGVTRARHDHKNARTALSMGGLAYGKLGRPEQEIAWLLEWVVMERQLRDETHTAGALNQLAQAYERQNKLTQAASTYTCEQAIHRRMPGSNLWYAGPTIIQLGDVLLRLGQVAEAVALWRNALAMMQHKGWANHGLIVERLKQLGEEIP